MFLYFRFDQGSPNISQSGNVPMSQAPMMNQPPMSMSQGGPMNQGQMGQQAPMNQGPMNYPQGGPMPHPPYVNHQQQGQQPQQQPGMDQQNFPNRYGNQGQPNQDQYNQMYHGGPQGGYGPRPPMMNNEQGFQGYPNQQGQYPKPPMQGGMYSTPNKRFPDNREFMSPGKLTVSCLYSCFVLMLL